MQGLTRRCSEPLAALRSRYLMTSTFNLQLQTLIPPLSFRHRYPRGFSVYAAASQLALYQTL
jgi:hypothetical protein